MNKQQLFIEIMFKNSITITGKTIAVGNSNWLMLCREVIAVCYENHTKCINALYMCVCVCVCARACVCMRAQNAEFSSIRRKYK